MNERRDIEREIPSAAGAVAATVSRREVLTGVLAASASALNLAPSPATAQPQASDRRRKLIKNATVVTCDANRRVLANTDVLIEGSRIAAIAPGLSAADAEVIDAGRMIAMPGFVDSHRHLWPGCIRQSHPDDTVKDYFAGVLGTLGPRYRPEDVEVGNLVSTLSAIDAGCTTVLDWSHISNTPEHSDAAIAGLQAAGIRAVYAFGGPQVGIAPFDDTHVDRYAENATRKNRFPEDLGRLRRQYFSSSDQLLTLALGADGPSHSPLESAIAEWRIAREVGARISVHLSGPPTLEKFVRMQAQGLLNAETTYIHCADLPAHVWEIIQQTGGSVSIAPSAEMLQAAYPAIQDALDHGIRPSLSVDGETDGPNDLFTQMRSLLTVQRAAVFARMPNGPGPSAALLKAGDVLDFATREGARANGLDRKVGSLEVGKEADLILLRHDRINTLPMSNPVGTIVLGMDTGNVDSVFIAGRAKKRHGRLVGVDLIALERRARASQAYILAGDRREA